MRQHVAEFLVQKDCREQRVPACSLRQLVETNLSAGTVDATAERDFVISVVSVVKNQGESSRWREPNRQHARRVSSPEFAADMRPLQLKAGDCGQSPLPIQVDLRPSQIGR